MGLHYKGLDKEDKDEDTRGELAFGNFLLGKAGAALPSGVTP